MNTKRPRVTANRHAENAYARDLRVIMAEVHKAHLRELGIRRDGPNLDVLGIQIQTYVRRETGKAFDRMAARVNKTNAAAYQKLLAARTKGHPLGQVAEIRSPRDLVDRFREANISLMERASRSYADDVRRVLAENPGARVEDLADQIKDRAGVSDSRADLIARDQTLKLNGQLNQARQQNAGVTRYEWSTSHDSHVRDAHAELDGRTFSWNDPPVTNEKGDRNHPGEDFQCRCVAIPVVDELEGV